MIRELLFPDTPYKITRVVNRDTDEKSIQELKPPYFRKIIFFSFVT